MSAQRQSILAALEDAKGPLSAAELHAQLAKPGLATVYRTLQQGVADGHLQTVDIAGGPTRYEPTSRPHHHHFHCTVCNRVFNIDGCVDGIHDLLPDGFLSTQHDILFSGCCDQCHPTGKATTHG